MHIKRICLVIILTILYTAVPWAQDMPVPVKLQFSLLLKILTFDRNLKERVGDEITIGIIYQKRFRRSLKVKEELVTVMNESSIKKIEGIPFRCVSIDISRETDLAKAVSKNEIDILYITPLRALGIEAITSISRVEKIVTLTGVPGYVTSGLAVGIGIKSEKPLIIINLTAAKAEGADFSSQLLKLARVIK